MLIKIGSIEYILVCFYLILDNFDGLTLPILKTIACKDTTVDFYKFTLSIIQLVNKGVFTNMHNRM